MNKKLRREQRKKRREMKQETTFDLEQVRSTVHRMQHDHTETRSPERITDQPRIAPEESIGSKAVEHPQLNSPHLQAQPDFLSRPGGEIHDRERI